MLAEGKNQKLTVDQTEDLRVILERGQSRPVESSEAIEVGQALLAFYEILADNLPGAED